MKCSFCGFEFKENEADKSCCGCVMAKKCRLLKCPNCGFEIPKESEWIKKIIRFFGKKLFPP
ncbi:MAG: hypothetical protein WCS96_10360 [Victivallales bacterium]|jgi:hypothetical protein